MNKTTRKNFDATITKLVQDMRNHSTCSSSALDATLMKNLALDQINQAILAWSEGKWTIRRPTTTARELVTDLIFNELEGNRSDGWQTFSVSDFLENWDEYVAESGIQIARVS
jgi:6-phosphogluconate dehydrogenase (decarboxylating)